MRISSKMGQIAASNMIYGISNRKEKFDKKLKASVGQVVCGSGAQQ